MRGHAMGRLGAVALVPVLSLARAASGQEAPKSNVEELVAGPAKQGNTYIVSPHGAHLATVTQKGSRYVVLVDGVEGPKFDDVIAADSARVIFSPDGSRYAYLGRSGQDFVLIVDGKEAMRAGTTADVSGASPVSQLAFTSNSKHYWFRQHVHKSNESGGDYFCIVFDGVAGLPGGTDPVFSPDGDHYACAATNPRDQNQQTVVLDGKPAGYAGTDPLFTGDSKHLFARTLVPLGNGRGNGLEILLDGKPAFKAEGAFLHVAPTGDLVVAVIQRSMPSGGPLNFLVIGGKKIEGTESMQISQIAFSPDGKRYAALCQTKANSQYVVVDGKKGQEYQSVQNLAFTDDSSRYAYQAMIGGKYFLVVDGEESDGFSMVQEFTFGGRGKRVGYFAMAEASSTDRVIAIDGVPTKSNSNQISGLTFSPDGSRWAYLMGLGNGQHLVLDGVDDESLALSSFRFTFEQRFVPFVFGPDGKHVAAFGTKAGATDASQTGLYVDGKQVRSNMSIYNPTFTPDGRHLLWMELDPSNKFYGIFADGERCAQIDYNGVLPLGKGMWEMGADGILVVLGQDGEKLKRLRVKPSADTSVEALIAKAPVAANVKLAK